MAPFFMDRPLNCNKMKNGVEWPITAWGVSKENGPETSRMRRPVLCTVQLTAGLTLLIYR
jgi:hypothetical protein